MRRSVRGTEQALPKQPRLSLSSELYDVSQPVSKAVGISSPVMKKEVCTEGETNDRRRSSHPKDRPAQARWSKLQTDAGAVGREGTVLR